MKLEGVRLDYLLKLYEVTGGSRNKIAHYIKDIAKPLQITDKQALDIVDYLAAEKLVKKYTLEGGLVLTHQGLIFAEEHFRNNAPRQTPKSPMIGIKLETAFKELTVKRVLGQGGAGIVYAASDPEGDTFAVKILSPDVLQSSEKVKRFKNEAEFCSTINHPNILKVIEMGFHKKEDTKLPFYVMKLFPKTLRNLYHEKIPPNEGLTLLFQMADAIYAVHSRQSWHRDLKPENCLIGENNERLVVADFGIAHFAEDFLYTTVETKDDSRMANFRYAAPEQRERRQQVDHRADMYAFGLMLNELFTGKVPSGSNYKKIVEVDPAFANLDELVEILIHQEPDKRPASFKDVVGELEKYVGKNSKIEVSQERSAAVLLPTTKSGIKYKRAYKLALNNESSEWKRLLRDVRSDVATALKQQIVNWGNEPRKRVVDSAYFKEMYNSLLCIYEELISVVIAGVESSKAPYCEQNLMLRELIEHAGWYSDCLVSLVTLPLSIGFIFQAIHGAACIQSGQISLIVDFATQEIPDLNLRRGEIQALTENDIFLCPDVFSSCKEALEALVNLPVHYPWLLEAFGNEDNYRICLVAYYMTLSVVEFSLSLQKQTPSQPYMLLYNFCLEPKNVLDAAYRKLLENKIEIKKILNGSGKSTEDANAAWSDWMKLVKQRMSEYSSRTLRPYWDVPYASLLKDIKY